VDLLRTEGFTLYFEVPAEIITLEKKKTNHLKKLLNLPVEVGLDVRCTSPSTTHTSL
jgi:hypothetical protein